MLKEKGIHWRDLPTHQKWGIFLRRESVEIELSKEAVEHIPKRHRPRGSKVIRNKVRQIKMPPLDRVKNRAGLIFKGEVPKIRSKNL